VNIRVVSGKIGDLSKSLIKKLNDLIHEIEQREDVIIDVISRKKIWLKSMVLFGIKMDK